MKFVAVDLGASSTRFTSDSGKISVLPNNMVFLTPETKVDLQPYDGQIENALEVVINKEGDSKFFPVKALIGQMAERFSANNERPTVLTNKHTQKINYISGIVAAAVSRLTNDLTEDISLYVALPPIEVKTAKEIVRNNFVGRYVVDFPKYNGGVSVKVNIVDVNCYEESFMAILSYFFEMTGVPKEKSRQYMSGNILSLDIGASTTDIAIVKDGRYLDKSGQTYKTGGNIARDYLTNVIRGTYGYDLPPSDADQAMAEGRLQMGNTYADISADVANAKMTCAKGIAASMQSYFRQVEIPIQTIRAIIVSGGGSLHSQYVNENGEVVVTTDPMSSYITEALKEICAGVSVESYGESPRLANINGLFIRAKVDMNKKTQAV